MKAITFWGCSVWLAMLLVTASAAHWDDCPAWQRLQALGTPSFTDRSGRGALRASAIFELESDWRDPLFWKRRVEGRLQRLRRPEHIKW